MDKDYKLSHYQMYHMIIRRSDIHCIQNNVDIVQCTMPILQFTMYTAHFI